tara:strand:+ start:365 stop:535 length:171 start_codon:yes stop_codon:yes gene_type:complete
VAKLVFLIGVPARVMRCTIVVAATSIVLLATSCGHCLILLGSTATAFAFVTLAPHA